MIFPTMLSGVQSATCSCPLESDLPVTIASRFANEAVNLLTKSLSPVPVTT